MEANMFGTAQAAPGETPVYEPGQPAAPAQAAPPAPEQTPAAPAAPTPQEPSEPQDPVLAAINEIRQEIGELKQGQAPQVDPDLDLLTALNAEPEPELEPQVPEPQQFQQPQPGPQGIDPETQRQMDALNQLIDERAGAMVQPLLQQQTAREMEAVQKRHPDIMEPQNLQAVADRIGAIEARTGAEGLLSDPQMVEQTFKLVKAEAAEASAVAPADAGGAVLETGAGQSQAGDSSFEDDYMAKVFGQQQRTPSIFG